MIRCENIDDPMVSSWDSFMSLGGEKDKERFDSKESFLN